MLEDIYQHPMNVANYFFGYLLILFTAPSRKGIF
jgi:hypothetical protein